MLQNLKHGVAVAALSSMVVLSWGVTGKICIDPGHGGSDPGAVGCGQYEKTNNLNTALKFKAWLDKDTNDTGGGGSWSIVMTRSSDVYVSLSGRVAISNNNGCNRFMCIHNNACGCGASGTETFCYTYGSSNSFDLRNKVQDRSIQAWGLTNRGTKVANFYVIKYTNAPAELAELGFIDNCSDAAYLGSSTQQDKMGKYHMYALQNHYGLSAYTPNTAVTYICDNTHSGFSCSSNWSTGSSSTDKYGSDYRFRSTAAVSDTANFTRSLAASGSYKIYAWWPQGSNRSPSAPYILPNGSTVNVNQQANGGKWNLLGTISLGSGNRTTKLSCWTGTGYVVIADAVKYFGPN